MIIFCCGLMRSGSTLQYQITEALVEKLGVGTGYGWLPSIENQEDFWQRATESDRDNYYIVKIHGFGRQFATLIAQDKARAIYVYRDLRDVVTSFMSWRNSSFEGVIRAQWIEKVLRDSQNWESLDHIHIAQYEVMMADIQAEVAAIAEHLGLHATPELIQEVADQCSIKKQRQKMALLANDQQRIDDRQILHQNHIKSGKSKRWREELTPSQIALIEAKGGNWMQEHGYELAYPNPLTRALIATQANTHQLTSDLIFHAKRTKGKLDKYFQGI